MTEKPVKNVITSGAAPENNTGEPVGQLATLDPNQDLTGVIAQIQCLFMLLEKHDSRFGHNGYPTTAHGQTDVTVEATFEGWQHPALRTFMASKGYGDRHELTPHDLDAIAWNLEKKLAQFQESNQ